MILLFLTYPYYIYALYKTPEGLDKVVMKPPCGQSYTLVIPQALINPHSMIFIKKAASPCLKAYITFAKILAQVSVILRVSASNARSVLCYDDTAVLPIPFFHTRFHCR